jgi:hypothetical protein
MYFEGIRVQGLEAVLHDALRQRVLEHGLQRRTVVVVAVERVRVSGATLVDEDDVAPVVQPGEKRQHLRGERNRALSRDRRRTRRRDRLRARAAVPG